VNAAAVVDRVFAKRLLRARMDARLTPAELGRRAGVGPIVIAQIEGGGRPATIGEAVALADALGAPLTELTGGTAR